MSAKQDRQGVRTPADIERKYDLSKQDLTEVISIASNAKGAAERATANAEKAVKTAEEAKSAAEENAADIEKLDERLTELGDNTGPEGPAGKDGEDGEDGATFTPSVSVDGDLSWTNDKGLANPETVNITGPRGETGATGAQGPQGISGVYIGTEEPDSGANVWIDPSGSDDEIAHRILTIDEVRAICT